MLKAIAIDDEPIALDVIRTLSENIAFLRMQGYFLNPVEASDYLQKNAVDLIFLDIKMPDISGIEFMKLLQHPPLVIFTTAFSEHAVQSFELDAVDYLLKPFSAGRFLKACNKALEQTELKKHVSAFRETSPILFFKSGYEHIRVKLDEILYAESKGNYIQVVTGNQKIISRLTMGEAEKLLPALLFIRIHRSYIVAKKWITKVEKKSVWLNQFELPIGTGYINEIEKLTGNSNIQT